MTDPERIVGVRALCEFTARRGDLDLRFTPAPSALEGIVGHRVVAARRAEGYRRELALSASFEGLTVRGRADGYDSAANRLEEIKTYRGPLERQPANHRHLHWAQAQVYGALLCRELGLAEIELALVYYDVGDQAETIVVASHRAADLEAFFAAQCRAYLAWSAQEAAHAAQREALLGTIAFPHAAFRTGQRELAEGAYRAALHARCLVAQAPTGIGKTIGTLFPMLKAWSSRRFDKLFFLTAKEAGRGLAWQALARLREGSTPSMPLRAIELVARDKACEHPEKACHGESCPLAKGFYDRLPAARAAAIEVGGLLEPPVVRALAREHRVCPYYLGQELVRWADVVIADYNHYFDLNAVLHGLALANEWSVALLVDEAHNLPERARSMYSAELRRADLREIRRSAPPAIGRALSRLGRRWSALQRESDAPYRSMADAPADFIATLREASAALGEHFAESPAANDSALLAFHFDALHFLRLVDTFGDHSLFDLAQQPTAHGRGADAVLGLRNLIPAPHLRKRFESAAAVVLFSATLTPLAFYRDTLGLPDDTLWLDVPSPFASEQLALRVVRRVSTRWRDRERSLAPIAALMARQYDVAPGNYLAFFSSFEYLEKAAAAFSELAPAVPIWCQSRSMPADARAGFLERFAEDGRGIGFAVLGGSFGEAIDLPGSRLVGAFVATLGLPPPGPLQEAMRARMETRFGSGYDYTYLVPGIRKVVQAVGRVIRTPEDRGVVHLIDDRFDRAEVQRLFPSWWKVERAA